MQSSREPRQGHVTRGEPSINRIDPLLCAVADPFVILEHGQEPEELKRNGEGVVSPVSRKCGPSLASQEAVGWHDGYVEASDRRQTPTVEKLHSSGAEDCIEADVFQFFSAKRSCGQSSVELGRTVSDTRTSDTTGYTA